ncbi:DUF1707 domain-containing protein [Actinomycetospora sp. TBRC 11914]|uniref:DUF1707 SHOCT-like domain-containing protein n=1 Tax=Actinomycetospora sp. TBRC 11914 TaxID=2729387 RepID=UPI00145FA8D2|nr:DUF1707 domain-containing protein [Actinomycetospora sp. TBRC 11914]NMO93728.1 DUF1707 domain-containing protein [Actinomycetospora sp. TBRC 11914]
MGDDGDRTPAERHGLRVGHDERTAALKALDTHFEAGRLDVTEYGERSGTAGSATYRHEIEALFTDLPAPHPRYSPDADASALPDKAVDHRPVRHHHPALALLPIVAVIGLVLLVVVGGQPGALAFFPIIFILAGRFGPRRF